MCKHLHLFGARLAIHEWEWGQKGEDWGLIILEYEKREVSLQRNARNGKSDKLCARSKGESAKDMSSPQKSCLGSDQILKRWSKNNLSPPDC